jgi:hypothetical protein
MNGPFQLIPDREALAAFSAAVFKNADPKGFVSLRFFKDDGSNDKALAIEPITLGHADYLDIVFERARQAAAWPDPAVFCPPVTTLLSGKNAKGENICEGVTLSVDCDAFPAAARKALEALLGKPTIAIASGGEWTNPKTGEVERKCHLHWRLRVPTKTPAEHALLNEARKLATTLVGGDHTGTALVHPFRWPGSWHRKGQPKLSEILDQSDTEIDLRETLAVLHDAMGGHEESPTKTGIFTSAFRQQLASNPEYVALALREIPNKDLEWYDWNNIGLAAWGATAGSEVGFEAFAEWSAKSSKHDGAKTRERWDHYKASPPTKIGFGTLVYLARQNKPEWTAEGESDVKRLNKMHAVLPIGGKTRVVTFGEMEEFPGRETIVMTQTLDDFKALKNKYRHTWLDKDGNEKSCPLGSHWVGSSSRRQYDGGMAFMPQRDGDFGNRMNLRRGFGVKPIKSAPGSRGFAGLLKFLDFMRDIICSGNQEHFDYLVKREATILQKRIRSEIALGLRTKEEGCGKGFYEFTMGRLLGTHAMQVTNPKHIVGNFNPHLETLLRLTADEALFVGSHEHRNALFSLITEQELTIEPKGCGVYTADSFLNLSITSNADHFLPVSGTARRFFIPTVSTARMQDLAYFNDLKADLEAGGYEALLHYFLHEVDLTGFNVRAVPSTAGLREQRDQSLKPLEAWWVELLETGTLMGSDPDNEECAVTHSYTREIKTEVTYGDKTVTQVRHVTQQGLYEQAKQIEPRLRNHFSDRDLGLHLAQMGCDNRKKVLRRRGWTFPPLLECRAKWEKLYPGWTWRDADIRAWRAEESDDVVPLPDEVVADLAADMRSRGIGRAT